MDESTIKCLLKYGAICVALLGTFVQISPIKINPWSALLRGIGKCLNTDVVVELSGIKQEQEKIKERLEEHIRIDDERTADEYRRRILAFNSSLLIGIAHTREEFVEILGVIDLYEKYCTAHPGYKNNRAVHAISHISKVYDASLENHNFLKG